MTKKLKSLFLNALTDQYYCWRLGFFILSIKIGSIVINWS